MQHIIIISIIIISLLFQSPYGEIGNATFYRSGINPKKWGFQSPYGEIGNATKYYDEE